MGHVILLGDSIFDNAAYVPGQPPVIEQLRRSLSVGWQASLLAVDGNITSDVVDQLAKVPAEATHLFVSVGGNDALGAADILYEAVRSVAEALLLIHKVQSRFGNAYQEMLRSVLAVGLPTAVSTIYDAVPGLSQVEKTALGAFNEVILRTAFQAGLPVIDLRLVCNHEADYSSVSPIEPSMVGGSKIARLIAAVATGQIISGRHSIVFS